MKRAQKIILLMFCAILVSVCIVWVPWVDEFKFGSLVTLWSSTGFSPIWKTPRLDLKELDEQLQKVHEDNSGNLVIEFEGGGYASGPKGMGMVVSSRIDWITLILELFVLVVVTAVGYAVAGDLQEIKRTLKNLFISSSKGAEKE